MKASSGGESVRRNIDNGIVFGYEEIIEDQGNLIYGLGGEYMVSRGIEDYVGKGSFHSIYGFSRYFLNKKLYGYGRAGQNFHTGDDDYTECIDCDIELEGGTMYGFGGGVVLTPNVTFECQFISHSGKIIIDYDEIGYEDGKASLNYTRTNFSLVYKFSE